MALFCNRQVSKGFFHSMVVSQTYDDDQNPTWHWKVEDLLKPSVIAEGVEPSEEAGMSKAIQAHELSARKVLNGPLPQDDYLWHVTPEPD